MRTTEGVTRFSTKAKNISLPSFSLLNRQAPTKSYYDHGVLAGRAAEKKLEKSKEGTWLLRKNEKGEYRITVKKAG